MIRCHGKRKKEISRPIEGKGAVDGAHGRERRWPSSLKKGLLSLMQAKKKKGQDPRPLEEFKKRGGFWEIRFADIR